MPSGGHNRKPDAVHAIQGSRDPRFHGDEDAIKVEFADGAMSAPEWFGDAAKREWFRICPILSDAGILKPAYKALIERYCFLCGEAEENGGELSASQETALRQVINMLGLGPASSSRVVVGRKDKKDGLAGLLGR